MRIATWNIGRLKYKSDSVLINSTLARLKEDILVLTKTNNQVGQHTKVLAELNGVVETIPNEVTGVIIYLC